jgi:hypothetical protein
MIAKLSALLFFALLIAIAVVVFGRLSQAFSVRLSCDRSFRDPCDPGVNLSVLEITACVSRTNISDGHPNKDSNDRRSDSNGCCHIVF